MTPQERERAEKLARELARRGLARADSGWRNWSTRLFPNYVSAGFSQRHIEFWEWVWGIVPDVRPAPFVAIWPRGGAKSTSAELACVAVGLRHIRPYALYVCETQDQADKHVSTIAGQMESIGVQRAVNKYGSSRGWRRNRLRTSDGFTIDALGLDTAARGVKVDADRPGFVVLDDIDGRHDAPAATNKKIETLTNTILPAGSADCAVVAVQNLIHANSVFSRLADGRADFLADRIVSGPYMALEEFAYEVQNGRPIITSGIPTWEGQDLKACQGFIETWGPRAFLRECQQQVKAAEGALWTEELIEATRVIEAPHLVRVVVGVDPEASSGPDAAETGIVVGGVGADGHGYVVDDASIRATPHGWATAAVAAYHRHKADRLVAEKNNGGEMVQYTIETIEKAPPVTIVHASRNKQARAEPVAAMYEQGRIHHIGYFQILEEQMTGWVPGAGAPSPDRLDALVWAMTELGLVAETIDDDAVEKMNPRTTGRFSSQNTNPDKIAVRSGSRWNTGGPSRWRR